MNIVDAVANMVEGDWIRRSAWDVDEAIPIQSNLVFSVECRGTDGSPSWVLPNIEYADIIADDWEIFPKKGKSWADAVDLLKQGIPVKRLGWKHRAPLTALGYSVRAEDTIVDDWVVAE